MRSPSALTEGKTIVQVVLPHAWVARINQLAIERGLSRSALIREAIARSYSADLEQAMLVNVPAS